MLHHTYIIKLLLYCKPRNGAKMKNRWQIQSPKHIFKNKILPSKQTGQQLKSWGQLRTPGHNTGGIRCLGGVSNPCRPITPAVSPISRKKTHGSVFSLLNNSARYWSHLIIVYLHTYVSDRKTHHRSYCLYSICTHRLLIICRKYILLHFQTDHHKPPPPHPLH